MAFSAGDVEVTLGGRFSPAGFAQFSAATNKAGADMRKAEAEIAAAQTRLAGASSRAATAQGQLGRVAKVAAIGGIGALGLALAGSVKLAADFEAQLSSLKAVTGANGTQMKQFAQQAKDAGAATKFSALDAAKAQTELAKGGLSVATIMNGGLKGALALAAAGELDLATAAATTANALNLFGLKGSDAGRVADTLASAANNTTADVGDFAMALTQGGAAAKASGLSFKETVVSLEALAQSGVKGSDAGTSLKTTLSQIAGPTKLASAEMKRLNLDFFDAQGKIRPLDNIAGQLATSFGKLSKEQQLSSAKTIAGTDGFRTLFALADQGRAGIDRLSAATGKQGDAARTAATKQDNLKGKLETLKGSAETAGITIGEKLLPKLSELATKGTAKLNQALKGGDFAGFGAGAAAGLDTLANVMGDLISSGSQVVGVLAKIGGALNLGDAGNLESIAAGFAGFKVATAVAPGVLKLAGAIKVLRAGAAAGGAAGLLGSLAGLVNPVVAATVAVGALAAAFVFLATRESAEEGIAKRAAAAKREQADAVKALKDGETGAVDKRTAAQRSTLDVTRAERELLNVRQQIKAGTLKGADAELAVKDARLGVREATSRSTAAHKDYEKSLRSLDRQQFVTAKSGNAGLSAAGDRLKRVKDAIKDIQSKGGKPDAGLLKELSAAQEQYTGAVKRFADANQLASISSLNLKREQAGVAPVTAKNAAGFGFLVAQLRSLPKEVRTRYTLDGDQAALSRAGQLAAQLQTLGRGKEVRTVLKGADSARGAAAGFTALLAGVPSQKVVRIIAQTKGKAEVDALNQATRAARDKNVKVTANAAAARAALQQIAGTKIASKVVRVIGNNTDARAKVQALIALGIPAKTARVLAAVSPALGGISSVQGALAALPSSKTITITTVETTIKNVIKKAARGLAAGRAAGGAETALIGEGQGREAIVDPATLSMTVVDGPRLQDLGAGEYVIPYEDRYRGRALGLMQSLAADMGLTGYAKGKKGRKPASKQAAGKKQHAPRFVPAPVDPLSLPTDDLDAARQAALKAYTDLRDKAAQLPGKIRDDKKRVKDISGRNAKGAGTKAKKARDLKRARHELAEHEKQLADEKAALPRRRAELKAREAELRAAQEYAKQIRAQEQLADTAATDMSNADKRDDQGAYDKAKKRRGGALAELKRLVAEAKKHVTAGSEYARTLDGRLSTIEGDLIDNTQAEQDTATPAETEADRIRDTGLTDAERARRVELDRDVSLAALTENLDDDKAAAAAVRDFFAGGLAAAASRGVGAAGVRDLADSLKTARDNVASLTTGTAVNDDADVQAQVDQQRTRAERAEAEVRLAGQIQRTFSGPGDIGSGSAVTLNINTLHPGSPAVASALAAAAAAGFGYQNPRAATRERVG